MTTSSYSHTFTSSTMLATFPQEDCIHVAEGIPKCCVVAAVYSWGAAQIFISKSASLTHSLTHLARSNFCKLLRSRRFFFQDNCTSLLVEVLDLREMILNSQFVIFIPNSIVALSGKPSQPNQPLLKSQDMVHACLDYTLMPGPFTFGL